MYCLAIRKDVYAYIVKSAYGPQSAHQAGA